MVLMSERKGGGGRGGEEEEEGSIGKGGNMYIELFTGKPYS